MIRVDAQEFFRTAVSYLMGKGENGEPHEKNVDKAEVILNQILTANIFEVPVQVPYMLATLHYHKGNHGLAIMLLTQVTAMAPYMGEAWNNLALAWRDVPDPSGVAADKAEVALKQAARLITAKDRPDVFANLAGICVSRNRPEQMLHWCEKGLKIDPENPKLLWHKALALLEMRKWDEAWDIHEYRLKGGSDEVSVRNYHGPDGMTPWWDGKSPGTIVIHGEQGIGDEIMFASCIPDVLKTEGCSFIFEPTPRMEGVFRRAFPEMKVYGTNDSDGKLWIEELGKPDYKIALGSLPQFYRRSGSAFPGTPYLIPDKGKRAWWGDKLRALPDKPNIGIAWQGGVQHTGFNSRSFPPTEFAPLFQALDVNWISLQYDDTAQHCVNEVKEKLGVHIRHWPKAVEQRDPETGKGSDIDELVALISKLDCVVTVCQTAVHIAGALGVPCLCLTPSEPSWRYGAVDDETMPWYSSVRLLRMEKGTREWRPVIERAAMELKQLLTVFEVAAQ